ncbi:hypothetical protein FGIG_02646 [Fasciola gigantica]|uniref:Uncharacterized protein n=1 Tax=Fasciola gigantica TaxID=46835 RepID=A0A504Y6G6_FASGI|nr:hypothetical protein FGIG_02646 [Fasciola gigantica]
MFLRYVLCFVLCATIIKADTPVQKLLESFRGLIDRLLALSSPLLDNSDSILGYQQTLKQKYANLKLIATNPSSDNELFDAEFALGLVFGICKHWKSQIARNQEPEANVLKGRLNRFREDAIHLQEKMRQFRRFKMIPQ